MTVIVSVSEFRNNVSAYLGKAASGLNVIVRDEKKGTNIARILSISSFNKSDYEKVLKASAGTFTDKHKEWKTKSSIKKWLKSSRINSERTFD